MIDCFSVGSAAAAAAGTLVEEGGAMEVARRFVLVLLIFWALLDEYGFVEYDPEFCGLQQGDQS